MESSNTGGFGIDGSLSTIIGAALANKEIIHYCVLGDLAFFYDMNALGNHNVGNNVRILLVNNGRGTEFRLSLSVNTSNIADFSLRFGSIKLGNIFKNSSFVSAE